MNIPSTDPRRFVLHIPDDMARALLNARRVYLLVWPSRESGARLIVSTITDDEPRAWPANYAMKKAFLILPPAVTYDAELEPPDLSHLP